MILERALHPGLKVTLKKKKKKKGFQVCFFSNLHNFIRFQPGFKCF